MLANRQTLVQEPQGVMAKITKADCLTIEEASKEVKVSKATLYNYMNILGVQRHRFAFDRKTYVAKVDIEEIKRYVQKAKA